MVTVVSGPHRFACRERNAGRAQVRWRRQRRQRCHNRVAVGRAKGDASNSIVARLRSTAGGFGAGREREQGGRTLRWRSGGLRWMREHLPLPHRPAGLYSSRIAAAAAAAKRAAAALRAGPLTLLQTDPRGSS